MKIVGIQIKSNEAILVVLEKSADGSVSQTEESIKLKMKDPADPAHVRQFRDQVNTALDNISPTKIAILARNAKAKGKMTPSPISFKLEGIIQLYPKCSVEFVWPQSLVAYAKKDSFIESKHVYQQDALNTAFYLFKN